MPFTKTVSDFASVDPREVFPEHFGDYKYAITDAAERLAATDGLVLDALPVPQVCDYIERASTLYKYNSRKKGR